MRGSPRIIFLAPSWWRLLKFIFWAVEVEKHCTSAALRFTLKVLLLYKGAFNTILPLPSNTSIWLSFMFIEKPFSSNWPKLSKLVFIDGTYNTLVTNAGLPPFLWIITLPIPSVEIVLLSANLSFLFTLASKSSSQSLWPVIWLEQLVLRFELVVTMSRISSESDPSSLAW